MHERIRVYHFNRAGRGQCRFNASAAGVGRHQYEPRSQPFARRKERIPNRFAQMVGAISIEMREVIERRIDEPTQPLRIENWPFVSG